ncbi:MAG: DUF1592 domain-containing protein [Verrucomicrobiota bacterium]
MVFRFLFALVLGFGTISVSATSFGEPLIPFLEDHCYDCHDDTTQKGGLDLFELGLDLSDEAVQAKWVRIYDRVMRGEMPPRKKKQPTEQERRAFGRLLAPPIAKAHEEHKGTVLRRLNREEYENTMNDLFGTKLNLADILPEDARSHEFSNVGEALSISMVQMDRYLQAADLVWKDFIVDDIKDHESNVIRANYAESREAPKFIGKHWHLAADGAVVFFRQVGYPSGMLRGSGVKERGRYKIRVTGYAYQSKDPITFFIGGTTFARGVEKPTYGYYQLKPGKPQTVEIEATIPANYMVQIEPEGLSVPGRELTDNGTENYKGPGLAIKHVEIEGPLKEEHPKRGYHLVFDGIDRHEVMPKNPQDRERKYYRPQFDITSEDPIGDATKSFRRLATAAFRRPVNDEELAPYLALFHAEMESGSSFEESLRTGVKAILCSPNFLFLLEKPGKLSDYALASRLSYFLNRTTPDQALLKDASAGLLSSSESKLLQHAERLLKNEHSERFVKDFTDAWLDLRNIEFTAPDRTLFPEFDQFLQHSMLAESRAFFRELLKENLSVSNLVKSDFAMLNNRLAKHYGLEGVNSPSIQRVSLPAESPRGGFLSQGSVLKVSANGTNTSPVVRGVWVMERILGKTPPPPPPGIPGVEPDIRGAETLRDLLDKHRDSESCRSCHQMIDPPGFALESFNPIGGWRDQFRSLNSKDPRPEILINGQNVRYRIGLEVDASGELADGSQFAGFNEFRTLLAQDQAPLARALVTKFLIFATGREMGFSDRPEINQIVKEAAKQGYGVRDLLHLAITSQIFLNK